MNLKQHIARNTTLILVFMAVTLGAVYVATVTVYHHASSILDDQVPLREALFEIEINAGELVNHTLGYTLSPTQRDLVERADAKQDIARFLGQVAAHMAHGRIPDTHAGQLRDHLGELIRLTDELVALSDRQNELKTGFRAASGELGGLLEQVKRAAPKDNTDDYIRILIERLHVATESVFYFLGTPDQAEKHHALSAVLKLEQVNDVESHRLAWFLAGTGIAEAEAFRKVSQFANAAYRMLNITQLMEDSVQQLHAKTLKLDLFLDDQALYRVKEEGRNHYRFA